MWLEKSNRDYLDWRRWQKADAADTTCFILGGPSMPTWRNIYCTQLDIGYEVLCFGIVFNVCCLLIKIATLVYIYAHLIYQICCWTIFPFRWDKESQPNASIPENNGWLQFAVNFEEHSQSGTKPKCNKLLNPPYVINRRNPTIEVNRWLVTVPPRSSFCPPRNGQVNQPNQ